jgi:hypothetical protein
MKTDGGTSGPILVTVILALFLVAALVRLGLDGDAALPAPPTLLPTTPISIPPATSTPGPSDGPDEAPSPTPTAVVTVAPTATRAATRTATHTAVATVGLGHPPAVTPSPATTVHPPSPGVTPSALPLTGSR